MTIEQAKARIAELEAENKVMLDAIHELREQLSVIGDATAMYKRMPIRDLAAASQKRQREDWKRQPKPPQITNEQTIAVKNIAVAVAFFDKTRAASAAERIAVGTDHWEWLESAARNVASAFSPSTEHSRA
jgi:hypothetical protein